MPVDVVARFLLLRHGESEWNRLGRWQGRADVPLTDEGLEQARRAALALEPFPVVASSHLERARITATIIAEAHGARVVVDERLAEVDVGPWQGLTRADIERGWPGHLDEWRKPPGFETDDSVRSRVTAALLDLASHSAHALVVSHSGVIRTLRHVLGADNPRLPNLAGSWFTIDTAGTVAAGEIVAAAEAAPPGESL